MNLRGISNAMFTTALSQFSLFLQTLRSDFKSNVKGLDTVAKRGLARCPHDQWAPWCKDPEVQL
jgi:hypothetical protein